MLCVILLLSFLVQLFYRLRISSMTQLDSLQYFDLGQLLVEAQGLRSQLKLYLLPVIRFYIELEGHL